MSKLGFVSEIRIDKKASDDNIKDYLKNVGKDNVLKTGFTIDSESLKTIANQLKEFQNFKIGIADEGINSIIKTMAVGFGQVATYTDKLNKDTQEWEQHISISSDRLKVQEEIYGRIKNLMKEKGKLERESIKLQGEALELNLKGQQSIDNQIGKYESFIDKEDLFNLAEYTKLIDQLRENQEKFDMAWAKYSQAEEKKKELEIEKQIAQEEKKRQQEEQKSQREKQRYLEKYSSDYEKLLTSQEKAEQKAFKDDQTSAFSRLVDLTKQRGEIERNLVTYSGDKLANAKEEYKLIKQSIKEQEKLIKNSGYESDDLRKLVAEQETINQKMLNRTNAQNKDNLQAQQYDKLIKALEKSYQLKVKLINASEQEKEVYEKQLKIVNSIVASSQSRIWNKSTGIRDEKLDQVVAQTKEIGLLQVDIATQKKAQNDLLVQQNKIIDELIKDETRLYQLRKDYANASGTKQTEIGSQISELEIKAEQQLAILKEKEIIAEEKLQQYDNLKIQNANKLKIIYSQIADQQEEQQKLADSLIEKAQRNANITLQNLMSGKNGDYIDTNKLRDIQSKINSLNAVNTKQAREEISKLNIEIRELASSASQRRLKSSVDGVYGLEQSFKSLAGYISGAMIIRELWQRMGEGVQYLKELDEAFTDVAISMDISREKFNSWTKDARKIAQANGVLTTSVMDMVKIYATAGESIEQIQDKLEGTAMIQNITQWDAEKTTSAVSSVINQYKLLDKEINGATGNVANAIQYMGDALIGISNELTVDNVAGIQEMVNAIDTAGGVMEQSGASMEWYMAIAGTLKETMNATGDEVGNAFKMISARIFAQAQAMEELGESSENIEVEMRKAEKALTSVGVAVRSASDPSKLREMEDIIDELAKKWNTLSDATKNYVAEGVAGTNRRNYFISMMENYDRVTELTNAGLEAQGELAKANEVRVNSLAGQINILTDKMLSFMDSLQPVLYGGVQFANVLLDIVDKFGVLPSAIGATTSYLLLFKKQGQELTQSILNLSTRYTAWVENLNSTKTALAGIIEQKKIDINLTKQNIIAYQSMGANTVGLSAKLIGLKASLVGVQIQAALTTINVVALQAAMSMGLTLAITAVTTGITKLIGWLKDYTNYAARAEEATNKLSEASGALKDTLSSGVTKLLTEFEDVSKKLDGLNIDSEERNELATQLNSIRNELMGIDDEYAKILNNETLTYQEQLALLKKLRAEKALDEAQELDKSWDNFEKTNASLQWYNNQINLVKDNIESMKEALNNSNDGQATWDGATYSTNQLNSLLEEQKQKFVDLYTIILEYNNDVKLMNDAGHETERTTISLVNAFSQLFNEILNVSNAVEEAVVSVESLEKPLSQLHSMLNDTDSAQKQFVDLGNTMEDVYDLIENINKNGLNFDNMAKVQSMFKDFTGNIADTAEVQEFLNQKFSDMEEAQRIAYTQMIENNNEYFENNIKNTSEWEKFTISVNQNLESVHSKMLNAMGDKYEKYFGDIADSYQIDLSNCKNMAEARIKIEAEAAEKIAKMRQALVDAAIEEQNTINQNLQAQGIDGLTGAAVSPFGGTNGEAYRNAIKEINAWKNSAIEAINSVVNVTKPNFSDFQSPSSSSSSSSNEKIIEDLENVADAYYEIENALKDVNNALDLNNAKQENATGKKRIELMREEVELLKKKQQLLAQYQTEMEKERDALKKTLQNNGFTFDNEGNIKNYQQRLKELQNWANSLKGDAKKDAIEFVESLIDVIDRYTDLVKDEIPNVIQSWEEMTTAIKEAEREQLEYVTQVQKDITSAIQNELQKRTDAIKKELQKQQDLYNAQYEEEDYQDNLTKEQRKLDEIQQQINDLSRDTSEAGKLRLQQLREEYAAQQEVINQMIRDWEKEQGNNAFQDALDKADEDLENALDPKNIADMVNKALIDGFVTIGDEVIELDTLMSNWLNETGDGLLAIGELLRSELLDSLVQASALIGNISNEFGRIGTTGVNVNTRTIPTTDVQTSPTINFNSPILTVEGDITENMEDTLMNLIEQAKYEVMTTVSKALQTY